MAYCEPEAWRKAYEEELTLEEAWQVEIDAVATGLGWPGNT